MLVWFCFNSACIYPQNHFFDRDIKPENMLLSSKNVKICDFGTAKCASLHVWCMHFFELSFFILPVRVSLGPWNQRVTSPLMSAHDGAFGMGRWGKYGQVRMVSIDGHTGFVVGHAFMKCHSSGTEPRNVYWKQPCVTVVICVRVVHVHSHSSESVRSI